MFLLIDKDLACNCGGNRLVEDKRNCVWLIYQQDHSAPLKLRQYGAIEIQLLLLLFDQFHIGGIQLPVVSSCRDLGVTVRNDLSPIDHY